MHTNNTNNTNSTNKISKMGSKYFSAKGGSLPADRHGASGGKKVSIALLLGFIFIINTIPVSFAVDCPVKSIDIATNKLESDAIFEAKCRATSGCTFSGGQCTAPAYDVKSSSDTIKTPELRQCSTVGYALKETDACSGIKSKCGTDYQCDVNLGWCCVDNKIIPSDFSGLKKVIPAYVPRVEIPCNTKIAGGECPANWKTDLGGYVGRLYQFGLMIAGIIAFAVIIYGAAQYTLSAGGFASKEDAKDIMLNAIYGLLLLFGAYLVLYTINPNLVKLKTVQIEPIDLNQFNPPEQIYISENNNQLSESSGTSVTSGIPGCKSVIIESGAFGLGFNAGITVTTDEGTQQYGTENKKSVCIDCDDTYTLEGGRCLPKSGSLTPCKTGLTGPNCTDCASGYNKVNGTCTPCSTGYTGMNCADCASGYGKLNNQCVKTTPALYCPSGLAGPNGTCIPK